MGPKKLQFCFSMCLLFVSVIGFAAPGDLDATFGTGGIVLTNYSNTSNILGIDAIIQSTGKIVVIGRYSDDSGIFQIALARFDSSGILDTTFGTSGWTIVNFGHPDVYAQAAEQQPDGKIVVTGPLNFRRGDGIPSDFYVARFTADGQVDSNFGSGGITVIDFGSEEALSSDVAVQADGRIVIAGSINLGLGDQDFGLARVDKKGKLDKSFGNRGLVQTDFNGLSDMALTIAVQSDKKIVAGGIASVADSDRSFALARYTNKGNLDSTFGTGGKVTTDFGPNDDFGVAVELQTDGKIVFGGFTQYPLGFFTFVRYNTDGTIDLSHTEDYSGSFSEAAQGLAISNNGRIILGGQIEQIEPTVDSSFALSCYNGTTGDLDTTFGASGWVITNIGPFSESILNLRPQSDNKIVAVGYSLEGDGRYYLVLTRYVGCG